jgi:predicted O-methyltransferase YrrM
MKKHIIKKVIHYFQSKIDIRGIKKNFYYYKFVMPDIFDVKNISKELYQVNRLRKYYESNEEVIYIKDYGASNDDPKKIIISNLYKNTSISEKYGEFLYRIIKLFKPKLCLELGTCLGVSSAYIKSALYKDAKLITIEGDIETCKIARESLYKFGFDIDIYNELFDEFLPKLIKQLKIIDFVYIDGNHDEYKTMNYFNMIYSYLSNKSIVIFDDIRWSVGMYNFWKKIKKDKRIYITIDSYFKGICYIDKSQEKKYNYKIYINN